MVQNNKEILVFKSLDRMADHIIGEWTDLAEKTIANKGHFSVALSGGSTPATLYQKLSERKDLPWGKTHVFMVDERFVPYESQDNNYHMINRTLLCHVVIPANNIHFISTTEITPEDSALRYEDDLLSYSKKTKTRCPMIDLVILGIGDDGHTASLFPGDKALGEAKRLAVAVTASDTIIKDRITIAYPIINNAKNIFFLATGKNKSGAVKDIIEDNKSQLPAAMVKPISGNIFYMLDNDSASLLSGNR